MKRKYDSRAEFDAAVTADTGNFPITVNGEQVRPGTGQPMHYLTSPNTPIVKTPDARATA